MNARPLILLTLALLLPCGDAASRSFRSLAPLGKPMSLGVGQKRPPNIRPVSTERVRQAVDAMAQAWNGDGLADFLDNGFPSRDRLMDTLRTVVPRDARLRVTAVSSISTLEQIIETLPGKAPRRISTVSALVDTQIEFNDPSNGFQSLRGRNEFLLRFVEPE